MKLPATVLFGLLLLLSPPSAAQAQGEEQSTRGEYRLRGADALKPRRIWDDGHRTYIVWPADVELPAVFSRGSDGLEVLADGAMRGDRYVLDRVHATLIFRIDRASVTAKRMTIRHE